MTSAPASEVSRRDEPGRDGTVTGPGRTWIDRWFPLVAYGAVAAAVVTVSVVAFSRVAPGPFRREAPFAPPPHGLRFLQSWSWWDGAWYIGIARHGYFFRRHAQSPVAFFPGYPLAIRLAAIVVRNRLLAGVLVSLGAGLTATTLFYRWCRDRMASGLSAVAVLTLLLYPCAFYLVGTVYADALFLCLTVASFVLLEHDHPLAAGLVCAAAGATRPLGAVVIVGLWLRTLERRAALSRRGGASAVAGRTGDVWVLTAPLGLLAWVGYLGVRFGHPLAFLEAEGSPGWNQSPGLRTWSKVYWYRLMRHRPYLTPVHYHLFGHAVVTVLALALVPVVFRRFGPAYGLYSLGIVLVAAMGTKDFMGMGRYVLAAFPCFAAAGTVIGRRRWLAAGVLAVNAALLLLFAGLHAQGTIIS